MAELLGRGEAEAAGERSSVTEPVVQEADTGTGTVQKGTAAGTDGVGNSRKRKVSLIIH